MVRGERIYFDKTLLKAFGQKTITHNPVNFFYFLFSSHTAYYIAFGMAIFIASLRKFYHYALLSIMGVFLCYTYIK